LYLLAVILFEVGNQSLDHDIGNMLPI